MVQVSNQSPLDKKLGAVSERAKEEKQERRRRKSEDIYDGVQFHLGVPAHIKEGENSEEHYAYYWANDDKGRIQYLTEQDDWDFVEDRNANQDARNKGGGSRLERVVGRGRDGTPLRAVYLRKRRDWHDSDYRQHLARLDRKSQNTRETQGDGSGADIMSGDPRHAYVPSDIDTRMPRIKRA